MSVRVRLARHAQTLLGALGRIVRQPSGTIMTMAVIAIALTLPLFMIVLLQNTLTATANWNQTFDLSVYLQKKTPPPRTQALAKQLRSRDDVAIVRVITADEALAEFRSNSGFGDALDALADNPLPDTLVVTPALASSTPAGLARLRAVIAASSDVQTVQGDTQWVTRLHSILALLKRVVWMTGATLALGVALVVSNTVRLDILNRRTEVEVMKLVGATDAFARRPFLYSGACYGLGGGILALLLVGIGVALLEGPVDGLAALYGSRFQLHGLDFAKSVVVLGLAAALGWVGSWVSASRQIRAVEPS